MKLLTKEIVKAFERQGYTGDKETEKIMIIVKFFNPYGAGTWFATDYLKDEGNFYGYVNMGDDQMAELGYFNLAELEALQSPPFDLHIERDMYFGKHTLKEVMDKKGHL